jgi:hypothetical protein
VELRPAQHLLERLTRHPPPDQRVELGRRPGLRQQQAGLVLREHAPRRAQRGGQVAGRAQRQARHHATVTGARRREVISSRR